MSAVYKLSQLVEEMGSNVISQHITLGSSFKDGSPHTIGDNSHIELGLNVKKFTSIADQFLRGHLELLHFIAELSSALGQINNINVRGATIVRQVEESPFSPGSKGYIAGQGPNGLMGIVEPDVLSDAEGPFSTNACNIDSSEHHGDMKSFVVSDGKMQTLKEHRNNDDEVRQLRAEQTALQSHMRAEFSRIAAVEHNLVELKQEKSKLEDMLGQEKEKLVVVQRQLSDAEQLIENLRENVRSVTVSRDLAQERLTSAEGINAMLESLLKESQLQSIHTAGKMESLQSEAIQMTNTIKSLEQSIEEEKARSRDLTIKVETLQDSLERYVFYCF
jgi:predicted  nucleic acid-binding Zn-ribbon protein